MDRHSVLDILNREGLEKYAHFGPPDGGASDKVCVFQDGDRWVTLITDERAVVQEGTIRAFASEADALVDMVDGLRVLKNYLEFSG